MNAITRAELQQLSPTQKAELIYSQARSELSDRLWRAALGDGDDATSDRHVCPENDSMPLDSLLALFEPARKAAATPASSIAAVQPSTSVATPCDPPADLATAAVRATGLGPNARHQEAIASAAARTGIPAPALAAIVNAEAAKGADGSWQLYSRNPRSSAAGLGQFLSSTWVGMANTKGSWLNAAANARGWIGENGRVLPSARASLLSLRYDAEASINAVADYARGNLDGLRRAGVPVGNDAATIAQSAYLGHHLGLGDAIKFAKGGLDPARARTLLCAQIGTARASQNIAQAGNATVAHRTWFLDYVRRNLQPERFAA
ncbi:peptidoglycan-binding protein [Sphingomonas sp. ac-8]|uniref:peptidoglycan-binding protein n=1 Tax=Sphingomonas sp. ac-8 TaxID=3242977 RepID=UPI003A7FD428